MALCLPAAHGTHTSCEDADRAPECLPAEHDVQMEAPAALLKEPASHATHDGAPGLGECAPGLQGLHDAFPVSEYVPTGHVTQTEAPAAPPKDPGSHACLSLEAPVQ